MKFTFVSDFDNTISRKDFYKIVMEKYLGEQGLQAHSLWQDDRMTTFDYLTFIFENINKPKNIIDADIDTIAIDETAVEFIDTILDMQGDFYIVSAGCQYYVDKVLERYDVRDKVNIFANPGRIENGSLIMTPNAQYFSNEFGIDKGALVKDLKQHNDIVFFAGDSRPDYEAAINADYRFARAGDQLAQILDESKVEYYPYENFADIKTITLEILNEKN